MKTKRSLLMVLAFIFFIHFLTFAGTYHAEVKKYWKKNDCIYVIYDIYYHPAHNAQWNPNDPDWTFITTQTAEFCGVTVPNIINPTPTPLDSSTSGQVFWPFDYNGLNLSEFPPHESLSLFSYVSADEDSAAKVILPAPSDRWFISFYDNYEGRPIYQENVTTSQGFIRLPKSYNYVLDSRSFIVIVLLDRITDTLYILHD